MAAGDDVMANPTRARARTSTRIALLVAGLLATVGGARGDEPVVTTLADYEDDSVAVRIADVENVLASDCSARLAAIPARGQRALMLNIGATVPNASAAWDLRFRVATPFDQADRVATYAWITQGSVELVFRVRDAAGTLFETPPALLNAQSRWVRLVVDLSAKNLRPVSRAEPATDSAGARLVWPIEIQGYQIRARGIGRQTVYLDDLEVEHRVAGAALLRGEFRLDKPTHIYEPGALVRAAVVLENTSRRRALPLSVQMAWLRSDGTELTTARAPINLPASGGDYRSRQAVDFSQRIREPGLYRLVARVRGPGWAAPAAFETTIAVTGSNRALPRGRATFFGVQTNLMREPLADQLLEIDIAREIGAQLLAIETPWHSIEPSPGVFDFAALDELIKLITRSDIAAMILLTEPPDWLAKGGADSWDRQAVVFEALARRYGERIYAYRPLAADPARRGRLSAADLAALEQIQHRVAEARPRIEAVTPPLLVQADGLEGISLPTPPADDGIQIAFETAGDSSAALTGLETFATQNGLEWNSSHRWFHRAEALTGSGTLYDAVAVFRHYVRAAQKGVGGVVWFDLRDDTNDARHPEQMKGLVQRDFSPKTPLLGFANAVGMLQGLLYAGQLPGTPAEFDSALFIGGPRQVAVLFPKPNRVLPAVLAPYHIVPGELSVFDFDRGGQPLARSVATPLVATLASPFFVTLDAERAQATPKLGLARPWLRMPATVYCGKETTVTIEVDAPTTLRRSYLQVILPPGAPIESAFSSRALRAQAGETLSFDVKLTRPAADELFEPTELTIRVRLEQDTLEFPVIARPLLDIRPVKPAAQITDPDFAIGRLRSPNTDDEEQDGQTGGMLHVGYQNRMLYLAIALPPDAAPDATLQLGLAAENADTHAEVRIENLLGRPELKPTYGTTGAQVRSWRCWTAVSEGSATRFACVSIPDASLGLSGFQPGTRLLLAARYAEPRTESMAPARMLEWGSGLDGTRSSAGYHWVHLAGAARE